MSSLPTWTHTAPEFPLPAWPDLYRVIEHPVRNWSERHAPIGGIDCLVIHDTATLSVASVLETFDNPAEQRSAHALIDRDGTCYRLVPWNKKAWHAGVSELEGRADVNEFSIGVELVDVDAPTPGTSVVGHHTLEYTEAQLTTLLALTLELVGRFPGITPARIVGHDAIARPVGRKVDPGDDFPWLAYRQAVAWHLAQRQGVVA